MYLGAHMSIAGGLHRACERAAEAGCDVLQIFTRNERQWKVCPLADEGVAAFREAAARHAIRVAFAHDSYLINMASPNDELWRKSVDAFRDELQRCERLGLAFLVTHPGAPGKGRADEGISRMIRALDEVHASLRGARVRVLLETTAGQGSTLGARFEELARIANGLREPDRVGICFDTCHVFAAGHDLRTRAGYDATMDEFDRRLGLPRLQAFHLNDSKKGLGERVDRHEHIGRGTLGLAPFEFLMNDPRFRGVPKVIETPKEGDMDRRNLATLRGLVRPSPNRAGKRSDPAGETAIARDAGCGGAAQALHLARGGRNPRGVEVGTFGRTE